MTKPGQKAPQGIASAKARWRAADEERQERLGSAFALGRHECQMCGACCWRRPPRLTLEDLERLAGHLGMSPKEALHRHCVFDRINVARSLMLTRQHQEAWHGRDLPPEETWTTESPCAFLGADGRCTVYDGRPEECRAYRCWAVSRGRAEVGWADVDVAVLSGD